MSKYRTALGKTIDMSVLAAKNEKVRAVGNMPVNARGDIIDAQGRIVTPVTEKVNQNYAKTVGNRSANPVKKSIPDAKRTPLTQQSTTEELIELSQFEKELEETMENDMDIEKIKEEEMKSQQKRGKK
jgi:type II secretory pathway component PulC